MLYFGEVQNAKNCSNPVYPEELMHNILKPPTPPPKPDYNYISPHFDTRQEGHCHSGSFIKVFIPKNPYCDEKSGNRKVVIYLHGFVLGASKIYLSHLEHLVKQGFYVFYPVYQRGFCSVENRLWKNLREMGRAVLNPWPINGEEWMMAAIHSVKNAYEKVIGGDSNIDTYIFGHSLGGLQALSWPYYARKVPDFPEQLLGRQVIVANPIPASDENIPTLIRYILNRLPVFEHKLDIRDTGEKLTVPVAILHGDKDSIVPVRAWKEPFKKIASKNKAFYVSQTDSRRRHKMRADHMQATVYTGFFRDRMASSFLGGVGVEDNLNWRYIWYALDEVICKQTLADELEFDMGKWSNGCRVKNPCKYYAQ